MTEMEQNEEYQKLQHLAVSYLKARKAFLTKSKDFESLKGNDNLMGRIGELVALQFFKKEKGVDLEKAFKKNEKEYDLCSNDKKTRVSVKLMSCENKSGQTTKITGNWTDFIFVHLVDYKVSEIGHVEKKDFDRAVKDGKINKNPYTRRTMLNKDHLLGKYGKVLSGKKVEGYL